MVPEFFQRMILGKRLQPPCKPFAANNGLSLVVGAPAAMEAWFLRNRDCARTRTCPRASQRHGSKRLAGAARGGL
ncbi:hypothetical protein BJV78DRAFT_1176174 [Lactifluus subvellereus]|nr:hypothetical protein BJV78DRAFT_1176174 [Lactifluus subvellereus]